MQKNKTFLISRTDSIGDVVLTLPMAGVIKQTFPDAYIIFLGQKYTKEIVGLSKHINEFMDWNELESKDLNTQISIVKEKKIDIVLHVFPKKSIAKLMKNAEIPIRIGTSHRIFHWLNCNKLLHYSRKKSELHEAQLNLKMLSVLGIKGDFSLDQMAGYYGIECGYALGENFKKLISKEKYNLILHPKSKGSAREWGLENFKNLIKILPFQEFNVFVTGTEEEGRLFREQLVDNNPNVVDLSGKMNLSELIAFIQECDGLVAASTGPLHIAAALGTLAIGIYPPIRPMHPGRWQPIGKNVVVLVKNKECMDCKNGNSCHCMMEINPMDVINSIQNNKSKQ